MISFVLEKFVSDCDAINCTNPNSEHLHAEVLWQAFYSGEDKTLGVRMSFAKDASSEEFTADLGLFAFVEASWSSGGRSDLLGAAPMPIACSSLEPKDKCSSRARLRAKTIVNLDCPAWQLKAVKGIPGPAISHGAASTRDHSAPARLSRKGNWLPRTHRQISDKNAAPIGGRPDRAGRLSHSRGGSGGVSLRLLPEAKLGTHRASESHSGKGAWHD